MMTPRGPRRAARRPGIAHGALLAALVLLLAAVAAAVAAVPAGAHAELTSSDPANASTVDRPVERISLTFSKASEPDPEKFAITGPAGPVAVDSVTADDDGLVVTVTPAESLTDGRFRLAWGVRAGDSHTMTGAIAFTVEAAAPTTPDAGATVAPAAAPAADAVTTTAPPVAVDGQPVAGDLPAADTPSTERVATVLRGLLYLTLLGAVGGTIYLAAVHRGPRAETRWLVFLVRRAAAGALVVSILVVPVQAAVFDGGWGGVLSPGAWADVLGSGQGTATLLRLVGAALVLVFLGSSLVPVREPDRSPAGPSEPTPVRPGGGGTAVLEAPAPVVRRNRRRDPVRVGPAPLAWLGALLLVVSESFVGHTADTAPRLVMAVDDAVHLGAAGLWSAGVALLAATARRRRGAPSAPPLAPLAARLSTLAAVALVAVAVTGAVMGVLILGDPGALWSSAFGRVLLLKVALVAVVAVLGGHHRRSVLPLLTAPDGPDDDVLRRFRTTLTVETALFVVVIGLTAVLVGASPVP